MMQIKPKMPITVYLDNKILEKLDKYCEQKEYKRSAIIRLSILELLQNRGIE